MIFGSSQEPWQKLQARIHNCVPPRAITVLSVLAAIAGYGASYFWFSVHRRNHKQHDKGAESDPVHFSTDFTLFIHHLLGYDLKNEGPPASCPISETTLPVREIVAAAITTSGVWSSTGPYQG
jgi:hypothetical protein